jgi:hypothetical protein
MLHYYQGIFERYHGPVSFLQKRGVLRLPYSQILVLYILIFTFLGSGRKDEKFWTKL